MKVSFELAFLIDEELHKMGYERNKSILDNSFTVFSDEELAIIEELTITNAYNIDDLILLPNLKKLSIKGQDDYDRIYYWDGLDNSTLINHIKDFSVLSKLEKLESLTISNDVNIKSLDVTNLVNLRELKITYNPSLKRIIGLEGLKKLKSVRIYGNSLDQDFDIDTYIKNTEYTLPNILDMKLYPNIVRDNPNKATELATLFDDGDTYLKFAEKNGMKGIECNIIDLKNLEKMYKGLRGYFKKIGLFEKDIPEEEKVIRVFNYVINNVKFAEDGLKERADMYQGLIQEYGELPDIKRKKMASLHSSRRAYNKKEANCEGVVNLMSFMLGILGIECNTVHCLDRRGGVIEGTNHAMIRIKTGGKWYFYDPTIERKNPFKFFMLDLDAILESPYHIISTYQIETVGENKYENDEPHIRRNNFVKQFS